MDKMYPQSEFENYKLQVELLQEKLQRSEENRHQLEHKLDQILQKRSEHDKSVRAKARHKYQEFLEEQHKRNERNKLLVQMLERIDEQSAALSSRSERLKMMKLQYEMYFAKLMQTQTMRCIQNSTVPTATTTAGIPVLLPTATATATPTHSAAQTTLKMNEQTTASPHATYQLDSGHLMPGSATAAAAAATFCLTPSNNFNELPLTVPQRQWTWAMATPTPAGMLFNSTPTAASTMLEYDYLKYPIGYLPTQMHFAYQQQAAAAAAAFAAANAAAAAAADDDLLSTQRSGGNSSRQTAILDEIANNNKNNNNNNNNRNNDVLQNTQYKRQETADSNNFDIPADPEALQSNKMSMHRGADVDSILANTKQAQPTYTASPTASNASPSATATSTSLTFDELPPGKSKTDGEVLSGNLSAPTAGYMGYNNSNNNYNNFAPHSQGFVNVSGGNNSNNNVNNVAAYEKSSLNAKRAVNEVDALGVTAADDVANLLRRQKIDETWASQSSPLRATTAKTFDKDNDNDSDTRSTHILAPDKRNAPTISRNFYDETFASTDTNKADETMAAPTTRDGYQPVHFERKEKMSIENIENEFYGELVKPPTGMDVEGAATMAADLNQHAASAALTATNELLEELTAKKPETAADAVEPAMAAVTESGVENNFTEGVSAEPTADYDASYAYQPQATYMDDVQNYPNESDAYAASAESYAASAEAYPQQENVTYSNEVDPSQDYQQYAGDPNLVNNPDYDYQQYDANAYQNVYDPNAYPGYTYDEATGQYTADPNQQYEGGDVPYTAADYAQQGYDEAAAAVQHQQQQEAVTPNYDYAQYQQQESTATAADSTLPYVEPTQNEIVKAPPAVTESSLPTSTTAASITTSNAEVVTPSQSSSGATKPTSILAHSADGGKTAANEAQQQKKKKRVNFVDSSETDDSSTVKPDDPAGVDVAAKVVAGGAGESDFDFSSSSGSGAVAAATNN